MLPVLGLGRVLGLDIGGSKTHAILAVVAGKDDGGTSADASVPGGAGGAAAPARKLAECTVGSANIASVGPDEAAASLDDLAAQLGIADSAGHGIDAVFAGAAGADTPAARERLTGLLSRRFPGARIHVDHDTRIILAAGGLTAGTVLISGTGSAAWAKAGDGREARAGGWGYLLGDEGSGYAVTRSAVRYALRESDDGLPAGPLTAELLARTGAAEPGDLLDLFYRRPERRFWAGLAGTVFALATSDAASAAIAEDAARHLAGLALTVTRRLGTVPEDAPVLLAGGMLVNQPSLATRVRELLAASGLTDVRVLDRAPAWGAVELASQLAGAPHRPATRISA
ncbi:N-acetylglucosamine kinase [Arthrobacter globiformis]|uniref:N-acetylglucosamine kinase n=1 Tax=Arthrobacter globiformis TaxID=1665 RepID=UPI0027D83A29|nr:BadF/BadG/BcrA/BcrD ATPase family protein [Arthrobacter globiformis]